MAARAEARGVRLAHHCAGQLWLLTGAGQLKQVLLNLLDNALRYAPAGGEVVLSAAAKAGLARIEVRDTGLGIDPRDLPHIFERFYQGDAPR